MFDSDPYDEWMETINKLGGLIPEIFNLFAMAGRAIDRQTD